MPRRVAALVAAFLLMPAFGLAEPVGRWTPGQVEGRPGASVVTLVGRDGISATRAAVFCDRAGHLAATLARRPGFPADTALTLTLTADAGQALLSGTTNRYGVLVLAEGGALELARLLAAARADAVLTLADGTPAGRVSVVGSTTAIGRVERQCGAVG